MVQPAEAVVQVLQNNHVNTMPRGELFIGKDFLDVHFPLLSGDYPGQLAAVARHLDLSAVGVDLNTDSSISTLLDGGYDGLADYFAIGCIDGPFSRLLTQEGFVGAMISTRKNPGLLTRIAGRQRAEMDIYLQSARNKGLRAIALADDIAGRNGLLFSPDYFARTLLPIYKEMAALARSQGLYAFLHSDGDMRAVIGSLVDAGFVCLHPVDAQGGLNLYELKQAFSGKICFMGHLDLIAWDEVRILNEIDAAERAFGTEGGLILGSAGGISLDVPAKALSALYPAMKEGEQDG